jgi:hypothetical protein
LLQLKIHLAFPPKKLAALGIPDVVCCVIKRRYHLVSLIGFIIHVDSDWPSSLYFPKMGRKMRMAVNRSNALQIHCSTFIQTGKGRKKSTAVNAMSKTITTMRNRSKARGLPAAARLAKTNVRTDVAATMMPRTQASELTWRGAMRDKMMIAATVNQLITI